jgi:transcriptional regulator of arginine metabolism
MTATTAPSAPRPVSKAERQRAILDLVRMRPIHTQEELVDALHGLRLEVTQATVSRDVRELGLVRIPDGDGLRYVGAMADADPGGTAARLRTALREHVRGIEFVDHLGVVRTRPSTAPLVAAAIDAARFDEVAGTVAGDDTVLVVARGRVAARALQARLEALAGGRG